MSNILQARVTIEGNRSFLWHRFGPDALPLQKQERNGVAGNDPTEWRRTVLVTPEGQLYIKPSYVFGCMRDAARHTKRGKGSIQAYLAATMQCSDEIILVGRMESGVFVPLEMPEGWQSEDVLPTEPTDAIYLDISSVKNPATKARNVRYRVAATAGWTLAFNIVWDKTVVSRTEMETVAIDAGRLCGLGDGRSIGYGRFDILDFAVEDVTVQRRNSVHA